MKSVIYSVTFSVNKNNTKDFSVDTYMYPHKSINVCSATLQIGNNGHHWGQEEDTEFGNGSQGDFQFSL